MRLDHCQKIVRVWTICRKYVTGHFSAKVFEWTGLYEWQQIACDGISRGKQHVVGQHVQQMCIRTIGSKQHVVGQNVQQMCIRTIGS